MFPASASGREAARLAQERCLVRPLSDETSGKQTARPWTISEAGLAHWLKQNDPTRAVKTVGDAIAGCRHELAELGKRTEACQEYLSRLSCAVESAFAGSQRSALPSPPEADRVGNGAPKTPPRTDAPTAILETLRAWHDAGDCPLPVLLEKVKAGCPDMSLGAFHDALRTLRDRAAIHLHPWTGPLYELPDPTVALLAGHEIAYYASAREPDRLVHLPLEQP
jgi:hypothetical protein